MVVPETAILADDFRCPADPGGGGLGEASRVLRRRSSAVRVLKWSSTAVRHPLAPPGASTEVPRRISVGFAHSAAAV